MKCFHCCCSTKLHLHSRTWKTVSLDGEIPAPLSSLCLRVGFPAGTAICCPSWDLCVCLGLREIETEQKWNYACLWRSSWCRLLPTGLVWFTCSPVNQTAQMLGHFSLLFPTVFACCWVCLYCNLIQLQVVMTDAPCFPDKGLLWSCQAGVQWRR